MQTPGIIRSNAGVGRLPWWSIAVATGVACVVVSTNASQGAYFSQSWGWVALAFLVPTTLGLILGRATRPGRYRSAFALFLFALASWSAASAVWSLSAPGSLREVERILVYASFALAAAFVLRRSDGPAVLAGVLVGTSVVCAYGLATRLIPDHFVTHDDPSLENRLGQPLGYPNALATFAAIGILAALAFVLQGRLGPAVYAGVALPILAGTLYFTFSRAAWVALALSYVVALILDPRWLRSLVISSFVGLPAILFVFVASQQRALTSTSRNVQQAASQGHRVAVALCVLVACSVLFVVVAHVVARRVTLAIGGTRLGFAVICSAGAAAIVATVAQGGPAQVVSDLKHRFDTLPVGTTTHSEDLNTRLFKIYGTGRAEIWPVAWNEFRESPLVGQGAGSFEYSWYRLRPSTRIVRDAHSLYLESLAEIGLVGSTVLIAACLLPLIAGFRARRSRLVPYATAAYFGWAVAGAVDWHWEMTGLTIAALLAGSVAFLAAETAGNDRLEGHSRAVPLTTSIALSVLAVVSLVGNQALFAARGNLARQEWIEASENARRARQLLVWSVEPDLAIGDSAAGLGNRDASIRAYRDAVRKDANNWVAWLRLAQVTRGAERREAYASVHLLNPLEQDLPGEHRSGD